MSDPKVMATATKQRPPLMPQKIELRTQERTQERSNGRGEVRMRRLDLPGPSNGHSNGMGTGKSTKQGPP